jgi:CheY-like chemotaxis protein
VSDTGEGIPENIIGRIMEPFFTTKEVGKGSGLGLSQVYGLVEQHEGFIDIRSELGKGTAITLYFPEKLREETEAEAIPELEILPKSDGVILLVEDETGVLDVLHNLLTEVGFTVYTASNGIEGLELYRKLADKIELVITDVVMPKMGGRELFQEIKKIKPDADVIFMTGHPLTDEKALEELHGNVPILHKPFDFAILVKTINSILNPGYGVIGKNQQGGLDG